MRKVWRFDPEKLDAITAAFSQRVRAIRPTLIVVSDPALLGVLSGGDSRSSTIDKMQGGVYDFEGITVVVTLPITAINQRVDSRIVRNDDDEEDKQSPYKVPDGFQILTWNWQKVGRFFQGKQRKLPAISNTVCVEPSTIATPRESISSHVSWLQLIARQAIIHPDLPVMDIRDSFQTGLAILSYSHSLTRAPHDGCFWSQDDHAIVLSIIRDINNSPVLKTLHNGSYDAAYYIRDRLGLRNYFYDSMVLWWSLYMELPKKLQFVTSVLCDNYQFWKDDIKGDEQESVDANAERYWRYNGLDTYYTLWDTCYLIVRLLSKNRAMQINYNDAMLSSIVDLQCQCVELQSIGSAVTSIGMR
jgi:hypothetical protein